MGEVKSTLDIIMEKTKGLTLSPEEKRELKRKEMEGKVRGLFQKYMHGIMDLERLWMEWSRLGAEEDAAVSRLLADEALSRLVPGEDNEPLLKVLEKEPGMDTAGLRALITDFERQKARKKKERERALQERLRKSGVSGSAVVPNLAADAKWREYLGTMEREFQERLTVFRC